MAETRRASKKKIHALLKEPDLDRLIDNLRRLPETPVINTLIGALCSTDETSKWQAVTALGVMVAALADKDLEAARVIMRRFMWMLNDESGGIGWGVPEAMAEIMANHAALAQEYAHILVSFLREDGFYLEHVPLQRGLMWGLGRLAGVRPELLRTKDAVRHLLPYLDSDDHGVQGLAALALGRLKAVEVEVKLRTLCSEAGKVRFYQDRNLVEKNVGELAGEALSALHESGS